MNNNIAIMRFKLQNVAATNFNQLDEVAGNIYFLFALKKTQNNSVTNFVVTFVAASAGPFLEKRSIFQTNQN